MEICKRDPEAEITESWIEELTDEINKHILENIKSKFPYYYWEPDKRKKYEDKFDIRIVGDNVMPYKVQHFIHSLIEEDIHNGRITRNDEHYQYDISLDDIHKVTYIYDPYFSKDKVYRYHQTENEYERSQTYEPIKLKDASLYGNSSKYIIKFDLI